MELIEKFIKGCIVSERRARILFELSKPKKYGDAISRFAHGAVAIIKPDAIVSVVDSEHIPQNYFKGELKVLAYNKRESLEHNPEWAKRFVSEEYGPIVIISSLGTALVKTEDNEIILLKFQI